MKSAKDDIPVQRLDHSAVQSLVKVLQKQPIAEVQTKVTTLIDDLLGRTLSLREDRTKLFNQYAPLMSDNSIAGLATDLTSAVSDVQRSFELQSEILEFYEHIQEKESISDLSSHSSGSRRASRDRVIDNLLSHDSRRRPQHESLAAVDSPTIVKKGGVFAVYSLSLWFLGIVTTLLVIEYVSMADWAVDIPISNLVY